MRVLPSVESEALCACDDRASSSSTTRRKKKEEANTVCLLPPPCFGFLFRVGHPLPDSSRSQSSRLQRVFGGLLVVSSLLAKEVFFFDDKPVVFSVTVRKL